MAELSELERVTQELAAVQDQLLALPRDAFAERYALQTRQDELRSEAAALAVDWDDQRTPDDLQAELKALKARVKLVVSQHSGHATGHGGGFGGGGVSAAVAKLANEARANSGVDQLLARINAIEDALAQRQGHDSSETYGHGSVTE